MYICPHVLNKFVNVGGSSPSSPLNPSLGNDLFCTMDCILSNLVQIQENQYLKKTFIQNDKCSCLHMFLVLRLVHLVSVVHLSNPIKGERNSSIILQCCIDFN
jgi:hypothetical protein